MAKAAKRGARTSVSVENITPMGIWLRVKDREYFLGFEEFPFMKGQTVGALQEVMLLHEHHIYWPAIDADLEIENLENPGKYPLKSKMRKSSETVSARPKVSRAGVQKRT